MRPDRQRCCGEWRFHGHCHDHPDVCLSCDLGLLLIGRLTEPRPSSSTSHRIIEALAAQRAPFVAVKRQKMSCLFNDLLAWPGLHVAWRRRSTHHSQRGMMPIPMKNMNILFWNGMCIEERALPLAAAANGPWCRPQLAQILGSCGSPTLNGRADSTNSAETKRSSDADREAIHSFINTG